MKSMQFWWEKWIQPANVGYSNDEEEGKPFIDDASSSSLTEQRVSEEYTIWQRQKGRIWPCCTVVLTIVYIVLLVNSCKVDIGSYEYGFSTEFSPAFSAIEVVEKVIGGWLWMDEHGHLYRVIEPGPQYVGLPSPEIDKSWEDLMIASEIVVSGDEARTIANKTVEEPDHTGWRLELDVYHSLHCVDVVRRAIDIDYYYPDGKVPYFYRDHVDHCVDYLRQAIQCQGDLTAVRYTNDTAVHATIPVFDGVHTCRDFTKIHEWAMAHTGYYAAWKEENQPIHQHDFGE